MTTGRWEDCPCCGASTFPDGPIQWDGTRVPCGCNCWVSIDEDEYDDPVGYITMGDDPCSFYAMCSREQHWEAEARRACAQPTPGYTPAVRRVVVEYWAPTYAGGDLRWESKDGAYVDAATELMMSDSVSTSRLSARCEHMPDRAAEDYWARVLGRLASFLQAQDRKHGGGS